MAKIYNDFQPANLMSFAKSFARLNGQPLDKSEIWYSLAEAQAYAATDAAYVGQILAVIDSEQNNVVFYGIQDAAGLLKEVGSTPVGDNLSIEIVEGKVQVRGFGKEYYAYVPAEKDAEGNIVKASEYVLTEGFKAGLEPRVVTKGEDLVIAWYEPGSETVEDVAANIESVSKTVESLDEVLNAEGGLVDQVDELKDQVGQAADDTGNAATGLYAEVERLEDEIDTKANADDVYTKDEADNAVAEAIAKAVSDADHLKRIIVGSKEEIPANKDALSYIYMVPTGLLEDDDKYDEYMVIETKVVDEESGEETLIYIREKVGSWEVDLSQYAKKTDLEPYAKAADVQDLADIVDALDDTVAQNKADAEKNLEDEIARASAAEAANKKAAEDAMAAAQTAQSAAETAQAAADQTQEEIDAVEEAIEGRLLTDDDKTKLGKLELNDDGTVNVSGTIDASNVKELDTWLEANSANHIKDLTDDNLSEELAEKINFITNIDSANFVIENGQLKLNENAGRLITDEEISVLEAVAGGEFNNFIAAVNTGIFTVVDGTLDLINIPASLLVPVVGDMSNLVTYNAENPTTIVDELNNLYDILTWGEMGQTAQ